VRTNVGAVDRDEPELRHIPLSPLEVVEQRPVEVARTSRPSARQRPDACERLGHVRDAARVVVVAEPVLGDVHRNLRDVGRVPDGDFE